MTIVFLEQARASFPQSQQLGIAPQESLKSISSLNNSITSCMSSSPHELVHGSDIWCEKDADLILVSCIAWHYNMRRHSSRQVLSCIEILPRCHTSAYCLLTGFQKTNQNRQFCSGRHALPSLAKGGNDTRQSWAEAVCVVKNSIFIRRALPCAMSATSAQRPQPGHRRLPRRKNLPNSRSSAQLQNGRKISVDKSSRSIARSA